jgi:hypothetical protein
MLLVTYRVEKSVGWVCVGVGGGTQTIHTIRHFENQAHKKQNNTEIAYVPEHRARETYTHLLTQL